MAKRQSDGADRVRQCAVTRAHRPAGEMIRFVLGPEAEVVPDLKCRLPGRGVWLTCANDVVRGAAQKNQFARAFKCAAKAGPELADLVDRLLCEAALGYLSLANKAGEVVAGFGKVDELLSRRGGQVICLIHAQDAAEHGRRKLDAKYARVAENAGEDPRILGCFTTDELSLALGRGNVVHAAMVRDRVSPRFLQAAARLENYRAGSAAYVAA